jgi:hypothetical protein
VTAIAAYTVRAIIESTQLHKAIAAAEEFYRNNPHDFHPTALAEWHRLLTDAGVTDLPEGGILPWLGGPHSRHLLVFGATFDMHTQTMTFICGSATHDRARSSLWTAATDYGADFARFTRAQRNLNSHYGA